MKEVPLREWAKRLLEDQIERLGELRNANPRDPGFKLWRQTTLTVIQRVWPGNLPKSEQFRRIAFTTPSARATRSQVREYYERGCVEAVAHLQGLIREINDGALTVAGGANSPGDGTLPGTPPVAPTPLELPDLTPKNSPLLDEGLIGTGPLSGSPTESAPVAEPPLQFLSPSFDQEPEFRAPSAASPVEPAPTSPDAAASSPSPVAPDPLADGPVPPPPGRTVRAGRRSDKRALKEMLGFVDEPPGANPAGIDSVPVEEEPQAPEPPASLLPGAQEPREEEELEQIVDIDTTQLESEEDPDPFDHDDEGRDERDRVEQGAEQLLRTSPVLTAQGRPLSAPRILPPTPGVPTTVAATLNALAADVARLGVPDGHRAATRAALVGLARQFDERTVDWSSIRQAIGMALEYPALARLLIPTLVPYLGVE